MLFVCNASLNVYNLLSKVNKFQVKSMEKAFKKEGRRTWEPKSQTKTLN